METDILASTVGDIIIKECTTEVLTDRSNAGTVKVGYVQHVTNQMTKQEMEDVPSVMGNCISQCSISKERNTLISQQGTHSVNISFQ
jgi:hypothetical protein